MAQQSIEDAVERAREQEPAWLRYKGTIIIVLTGLVSILSQLAAMPEWDGTTIGVGFTIAATLVGALANRFTKDGITPSMAGRIAAAEAGPTVGGVTNAD